MAQTTKYGFFLKKSLLPSREQPAALEVILKNSAALVIGQAVELDSGFLDGATVSEAFLGILVGIVDKNGQNIFKQSLSPKPAGTIVGNDTYTAASNNQTVDQIKGEVVIDPFALFLAYSDSTLTQAGVGLWFNGKVNAATYIDGVTGSGGAYSAGTQQFQMIELVSTLGDGSTSTTTGLFKIGRSQLLNDITA